MPFPEYMPALELIAVRGHGMPCPYGRTIRCIGGEANARGRNLNLRVPLAGFARVGILVPRLRSAMRRFTVMQMFTVVGARQNNSVYRGRGKRTRQEFEITSAHPRGICEGGDFGPAITVGDTLLHGHANVHGCRGTACPALELGRASCGGRVYI